MLSRSRALTTRFIAALATWTLIFFASPGILSENGAGLLAFVALVPWALYCSRPGPRAFWIEWLAAAIGISALCIWSTYVLWITLLAVAIVPAAYMAVAGVVLRRLALRFPLAIAAPAAWVALETLRFLIQPPFGFGWMHLGTNLHATSWINGSARVFGVGGLSFVAAAFAGGIADVVRERRLALTTAIGALVPLAAAMIAAQVTHAPEMKPGPRLLLVQPAFEQHRKMTAPSPDELVIDSLHLTEQGLAEAARAGEAPDLVCWGETMYPASIVSDGLLDAYDHGARSVSWAKDQVQRRDIQWMTSYEKKWIDGALFGRGKVTGSAVLPRGTSFLTGAEYFAVKDGAIRRFNAVLLWNGEGVRDGVGGKIHLVPGGEQLCGLERIALVRELSYSLAGYVPDLAAFERTQVFTLHERDGNSAKFGVTVCFDNAYEDPYTEPLRRGELDFHLVCSNEAWYEESFEYDQMIAFSRLLAIETGRSFVRATNAGITIVIGPDGGDVARLERGGKDRMVPGTLSAVVPVPRDGADAPTTCFVRSERVWQSAWIALPLALLAGARRRRSRRPAADRRAA
jgi:apolipoprotein N-acyltransferase